MELRRVADTVLVTSLIILNIVIKSVFIGGDTIDIDEPYSIYHAQGSLSDLFGLLKYENNPPLFFIVLHFWIKVFGIEPAAARFLPMLFSSLTAGFIYLIGKRYGNRIIAVASVLLFTFSNLNIMEAHDTRAYSLFLMLSTMSMYFYFLLIDDHRKGYAVALTIVNILLVFTHLFGVFVLFLQSAYVIFIPVVRKRIVEIYAWASLFLLTAYLPYLIFIFHRFVSVAGSGLPFPKAGVSSFYTLIWSFTNYDAVTTNLCLAIIFLFCIVVLVARLKLSVQAWMIMGWFAIPYVVMILISYVIAIAIPKYMIYITPGFYLAIAFAAYFIGESLQFLLHRVFDWLGKRGISIVYTRWTGKIIGLLIISGCIVKMIKTTDIQSTNYSGASESVAAILKHRSPETKVYLAPPWLSLTFAYYYDKSVFSDYGNVDSRLFADNIHPVPSIPYMEKLTYGRGTEVLLLNGYGNGLTTFDPEERIYRALSEKFKAVDTLAVFSGYRLYRFSEALEGAVAAGTE